MSPGVDAIIGTLYFSFNIWATLAFVYPLKLNGNHLINFCSPSIWLFISNELPIC